MRPVLLGTCLIVLIGCTDTGRTFVELPLQARGVDVPTFAKDGWGIELTRADIGFGPIYICATASANTEFCEAATLEFIGGATIDGLDGNPQPVGQLFGTTGVVRSSFFDYGITWLLTQSEPVANDGVPGGPASVPIDDSDYVPQGHSARFAGTATCTGDPATCCPDDPGDCPSSYAFEANVDIVVLNPGTSAVNGVDTDQRITTEPLGLTLRFDPVAWWQQVDFARLAALDDDSGDPVVLDANEPDYSALVIAMTSNSLPTFEWSSP